MFSYIHQPYVALAVKSCHVIIHTEESKNNMFPNCASHGLSKNMHLQEQINTLQGQGTQKNMHAVTINYSSTQNITRKTTPRLVNRKISESTVCLYDRIETGHQKKVLLGRLPQRGSQQLPFQPSRPASMSAWKLLLNGKKSTQTKRNREDDKRSTPFYCLIIAR